MWDHPSPIFLDFETQSACDIKESGGKLYAEHPSTRILILSLVMDGVFHTWIPDYIKVDTRGWTPASLWPYQMKPSKEVRLYRGTDFTRTGIYQAAIASGKPLVAHNAYGFDRYIWNRFFPDRPQWLDSLLLAKKAGRIGRLDALGKALLGTGKDHAKKLLPKLTRAEQSNFFSGGYKYPTILNGDLQAFTRYANGDVYIISKLWDEFADVAIESDVIEIHETINKRGVDTDIELLDVVERLSRYSTSIAINEISRLTRGKLHAGNLRSGLQVHEWLGTYGVCIVDDKGKPCLRKEIVQKFIDSPFVIEENLTAATEIPPLVIEVMKLRLKALRITEAKVTKAKSRVSSDGRMRDLFTYHNAHTGRWSSHGVNIHNLPRPLRFVSEIVESLLTPNWHPPMIPQIDYNEKDIRVVFDSIKSHLPKIDDVNLSVDDICSGLMRPSFRAKEHHLLVICDYGKVEACGLAWIADEKKLIQAFLEGRDIYKEFAAIIFHVPLSQVTKEQRQVAKNAILGCGYGLGADKFRVYAANNGADLVKAGVTADACIDAYRNTYTRIVGWKPDHTESFRVGGIWKELDKAVKECVGTGQPRNAGKCRFVIEDKDMLCILPSTRTLYYPNVRIEDVIPPYCYTMGLPLVPKATVVYDSQRGVKSLYGGLITENIVQAICRDLLACAILQLESEGYPVVLHVHDEIACEVPEQHAKAVLRRMVEIMSSSPKWAEGFPISCEGYVSPRFVKSAFAGFAKMETKQL
jgi:DNA polymerase bacteriophage-type